jgi:hypothetical protein
MGVVKFHKERDGRVDRKEEYLFSDSLVLRAGGRIPDDVKDFIRSNFMQKRDVLRLTKLPGYNREMLSLIFKSDSPLIPARIELDQMGSEEIGKEIMGESLSVGR